MRLILRGKEPEEELVVCGTGYGDLARPALRQLESKAWKIRHSELGGICTHRCSNIWGVLRTAGGHECHEMKESEYDTRP